MNKVTKIFAVVMMVLLVLVVLPSASAASQSVIAPIGGVADTCVVDGSFSIPVSYTFTGTGSDTFKMTAPGYGQLNSAFTQELSIGYAVGSGTNTYGTGSLNYSLPAHTLITLTIVTYSGNNYTGTTVTSSFTYDCTTGGEGEGVFQGAPIPSGFVLRTITCDTPVYDAAGGHPLSTGEKVTAGQTWFVSPTAQSGWTEIFNNGFSDGFIPSSCVGGAPAGY